MITFQVFNEATINGKVGSAYGEYHRKKYLDPHVGSGEFTHTVAKSHGEDHPEGSMVRIHGIENIGGKYHAHVTNNVTGKKSLIPVTKLHKPGTKQSNKGHEYETNVAKGLKKYGIMASHEQTAGSGSGTDFYLHNKKEKDVVKGRLNGEAKEGKTAAFGQLTIEHHPQKGWHIPDHARKNRPEYAKHIEKALGPDGKTPLLQWMNDNHHKIGTPEEGRATAEDVHSHSSDLSPAHAYLHDHNVHVVQVGHGHGLYKTGEHDPTGMNVPKMSGEGHFRVRQKTKDPKKRTVQFMIRKLDKSHVNLENEDHVKQIAKNLGHSGERVEE